MIQVVVVLVLIPSDLTQRAIDKEEQYVQRTLGTQSQEWIKNKATDWYQSSLIDSGVYQAVYNHFIPTQAQKEASRGMQNMGGIWFTWVEGRLQALTVIILDLLYW